MDAKKYIRVAKRKIMFTVLANGGAPSGQSWPRSTTTLRQVRMIRMALDPGFMDVSSALVLPQ
jgi:hypothetical protein